MSRAARAAIWVPLLAAACAGGGEAASPDGSGLPYYRTADLAPEWVEGDSVARRLGDFALLDQRGRTVTEEDLDGEVVVANFFYASCAALCPVLQRSMGRVQAAFLADDRVRLVSHTIDPETDTVERLAAYGETHGMVPGKWYLLTGERADVVALAAGSYFVDLAEVPLDDDRAVRHAEEIFLLDGEGRIRGVYNGSIALEIDHLIEDARALLESS